jgi:hypothetical protein
MKTISLKSIIAGALLICATKVLSEQPAPSTQADAVLEARSLRDTFPTLSSDHRSLIVCYAYAGPRLAIPEVRDAITAAMPKAESATSVTNKRAAAINVEWLRERPRKDQPLALGADYYVIQIAAVDRQETEVTLRNLMAAHDAWWAKHWQAFVDRRIRELDQERQKLGDELEKNQTSLKSRDDEMKELAERIGALPGDEQISALRVRQMLLSVDLAGVDARIKEAQKMIIELGAVKNANRLESLEALKAAAQVELAGIHAQRTQVQTMLGAASNYAKLRDEHTSLQIRDGSLRQKMQQADEERKKLEEVKGPAVFALDGKVSHFQVEHSN